MFTCFTDAVPGFPNVHTKGPVPSSQSAPQTKGSFKRPMEQALTVKSNQIALPDSKRFKPEPVQQKKPQPVATTQAQLQAAQQQLKVQSKSEMTLKTTKVFSKSGGFTEERISDAQFKKFLEQYDSEDELEEDEDIITENQSGKFVPFAGTQSKAPQTKAVSPMVQKGSKSGCQVFGSSVTDKNLKNNQSSLAPSKPLAVSRKDFTNDSKLGSLQTQGRKLDIENKLKSDGKCSPMLTADTGKANPQSTVLDKGKEGLGVKSEPGTQAKKDLER